LPFGFSQQIKIQTDKIGFSQTSTSNFLKAIFPNPLQLIIPFPVLFSIFGNIMLILKPIHE